MIISNLSAMGVVYKLDWLDLLMQLDPAQVADVVKWAFMIVLVTVTAFAGLKHARGQFRMGDGQVDERERLTLARTWLALIVLAQMQSPFLPLVYGSLAVVWLIALFAVPGGRTVVRGLLVTMGWLLFAFPAPFPIGPKSIATDLAVTLFAFFVAVTLCISLVICAGRTRSSTTPATLDAEP